MRDKFFLYFMWTTAFISILLSFFAVIKGNYPIATYHLFLGAFLFWLAKETYS